MLRKQLALIAIRKIENVGTTKAALVEPQIIATPVGSWGFTHGIEFSCTGPIFCIRLCRMLERDVPDYYCDYFLVTKYKLLKVLMI
jgi:hypothetical protein